MADSAAFQPVRRSGDQVVAAPGANELSADAQASCPRQLRRLRPSGAPAAATAVPVRPSTVPARPLPEDLRQRAEVSSGLSLHDVRVHYNSPLPLQVLASAFTAGSDIHLSPGAEQDLGHEVGHAIQQRLGRVRPTTSLGGVPVNADRWLEHEADALGTAIRGGAALEMGTGTPVPSGTPVLQGRWLVDVSDKTYFWEEDGDGEPKAAPSVLNKFAKVKTPEKGTYSVDRGPRGTLLVLTLEQYIAENQGGNAPRTPRDSANPLGRMTPQKVNSFIPSPTLDQEQQERILDSLAKKDPTFRKVTAKSKVHEGKIYPQVVQVQDGARLRIVAETLYGAVYAAERPQKETAARRGKPQSLKEVSKLPPRSSDVKIAWASSIDKAAVQAWTGRKREKSQKSVMGASARDVAKNAGFDPHDGLGWEWLHLVAHSMGGIDFEGPQVANNLVAGTSECNTQMIIVEEFLKDYVVRNDAKATLVVHAEMEDADRHIGKRITYDFYVTNKGGGPVQVFHWTFDPLSRTNPITAENRTLREAGRVALERGGEAATKHTPMSQPTTHDDRPGADRFSIGLDLLDGTVEEVKAEFRTARSPGEFVKGLVSRRNKEQARTLSALVFDEIGGMLSTREMARQVVMLLDKQYGEGAARAVLWSYLDDHHTPKDLTWLWDNLVKPHWGTAVPQKVQDQFDKWQKYISAQPKPSPRAVPRLPRSSPQKA